MLPEQYLIIHTDLCSLHVSSPTTMTQARNHILDSTASLTLVFSMFSHILENYVQKCKICTENTEVNKKVPAIFDETWV